MTKPASTTKKPRKQHTPEFRQEALKLAERIGGGGAAAARELNLYESQLHNWRSKQQNQLSSSEREQEMSAEIARLKRQLAERDEELAILQNGRDILREAPEMKYVFIEKHQAEFNIKAMCRV
ncbi:IS3 family transposase, partial [Salmonella enterica subsp. enterica serovar Typhimurium]|nr:IS3 family transposase [Salmonella enterica subsp. enterica serovar Typhimurium]